VITVIQDCHYYIFLFIFAVALYVIVHKLSLEL